MTRLYLYGAILVVLLLGIGAAGAYLHHKGFVAGVASMQAALSASTLARDQAVAQAKADDAAVAQVKAQLDANAQEAQAQQQAAQVAVAKAKANAADADKALSKWMAAYATALRNPDCQKPSVVLCSALRVY